MGLHAQRADRHDPARVARAVRPAPGLSPPRRPSTGRLISELTGIRAQPARDTLIVGWRICIMAPAMAIDLENARERMVLEQLERRGIKDRACSP